MIARLAKASPPATTGQLAGFYELTPPLHGHGAVWISAIPVAFDHGGPETMIFPLDDRGEPDRTVPLETYFEHSIRAALEHLGYTVDATDAP